MNHAFSVNEEFRIRGKFWACLAAQKNNATAVLLRMKNGP
jgi:hypothetical protein